MVFRLESDENGDPITRLDNLSKAGRLTFNYKDLYLQLSGGLLDPAQTNLAWAKLARDTSSISMSIVLSRTPVRYEASFVLRARVHDFAR